LDHQGRIESTVLTVPSPGRTAMVFASRAVGRSRIAAMAGLIRVATERLADHNVNLAQALLDPAELPERETFHAAGYRDLAILAYLERLVPGPSAQLPQPDWPQGFAIAQFKESMRQELVDVLSASYEDTLDCPGLRGHRRTEDILEGHLATGRFDPRLWTLLRNGSQPIGTILLSSSADRQSIELVYLGLVKSARGKSLGRELLRHGLNLVKGRPERTINLAVDEANAPAARLYASEGFRPALRRRALICPV
jgi:ribosomal protein S18 acetylase RimI-like enzyme